MKKALKTLVARYLRPNSAREAAAHQVVRQAFEVIGQGFPYVVRADALHAAAVASLKKKLDAQVSPVEQAGYQVPLAVVCFGFFMAQYREASTQLFGELPAPFVLKNVPGLVQRRILDRLSVAGPVPEPATPHSTEEARAEAADTVVRCKVRISCLYALGRLCRLTGPLEGEAAQSYQELTSRLWGALHSAKSNELLLASLLDSASSVLPEAMAMWGDGLSPADGPWEMLALLNPDDSAFTPVSAADRTVLSVDDVFA